MLILLIFWYLGLRKRPKRRTQATKALKMTAETIDLIDAKIMIDWSPEQISGWLRVDQGIKISHERIYQHIWTDKRHGGTLYLHLRQSNKKRKEKYGSKDKRGQIRNRVSIDDRPEIVAQKTRIGDWEIDTVIGKNHQGALVTLVDRVSKFTLIKKVDSKHAEVVTEATIILLQPYLDKTLTITADNGKEFAGHEEIKVQLDADVYFAHPYHSWERGLNENTNGLIRQYFTKGSSFENITDDEVMAVTDKLNHRPRKTLNYKTPHAVFFAESGQEAA
ncbi:MAG: IS30 family transposase [Gallionella sp.]|nr:IS30 family transposase [Methylobacter sp.]MDP2430288.1 IS30 family transposase [Methylobacter sp.]MDP3056558.1 IS30 family transposase [Methylobacter sp.]MDP3363272.1 IS30 family transposase [Methylobacter sp.]MDZ4202842.1 IS30 family transposase [Gallionella sp.]